MRWQPSCKPGRGDCWTSDTYSQTLHTTMCLSVLAAQAGCSHKKFSVTSLQSEGLCRCVCPSQPAQHPSSTQRQCPLWGSFWRSYLQLPHRHPQQLGSLSGAAHPSQAAWPPSAGLHLTAVTLVCSCSRCTCILCQHGSYAVCAQQHAQSSCYLGFGLTYKVYSVVVGLVYREQQCHHAPPGSELRATCREFLEPLLAQNRAIMTEKARAAALKPTLTW